MRTQDLPLVDCPDAPRERGRAHGEALRGVIAAKVGRWHEAIGLSYGMPARRFIPLLLASTDFRAAIARWTPDLADEVEGIAQGAALSADDAFAMQLMDEEWWFGASGAHHCSSLAVAPAGGRPTLVAQTMDLARWHDGAQALLRFADSGGAEKIVFTSAGMIGLMGVSGHGLGVCVNTLSRLAVDRRGLPVAFVMRGALAQRSCAAAAGFLGAVTHASGQAYQLGDRGGVATFECSAGGAVAVPVAEGFSPHTNHPLASRDLREAETGFAFGDNSVRRLESLRADLGSAPVSIAAVRSALSACRADGVVSIVPADGAPPTASMSVGAVIYEIGDRVALHVAAGPPSLERWREMPVAGDAAPQALRQAAG